MPHGKGGSPGEHLPDYDKNWPPKPKPQKPKPDLRLAKMKKRTNNNVNEA